MLTAPPAVDFRRPIATSPADPCRMVTPASKLLLRRERKPPFTSADDRLKAAAAWACSSSVAALLSNSDRISGTAVRRPRTYVLVTSDVGMFSPRTTRVMLTPFGMAGVTPTMSSTPPSGAQSKPAGTLMTVLVQGNS